MNSLPDGRNPLCPRAAPRPAGHLTSRALMLVVGAALVAGCSGTAPERTPGAPDIGQTPDAGEIADAGQTPDSGARPDAGPADSGAADAGEPEDLAQVDFALVEDFGSDRVVGVEVCLWDVEADTEDCQTLDRAEGLTFRPRLGRQVYFRVRGAGYASTAYPHLVQEARASIEHVLLTTQTQARILASGGVVADPSKGTAIVVLDRGGSQDPRVTRSVQIRSDDPTAEVHYAQNDITEGVDPTLVSTSSAAGRESAAGLFNVAPGVREVRLVHPHDPSCRLNGYPRAESDAPYRVHVFEDTLTQLRGACEAADRGRKECSVFDQDCSEATDACRTRAFTGVSGMNEVGTTCEPARGEALLGASCSRPTGEAGVDTCSPGLYCAYWGLPRGAPQARECKLHCDIEHPCDSGQRCKSFGVRVPTEGACLDECDPFDDQCGPGLNCTTISTSAEPGIQAFTTCQFEGSGGVGEACGSSEDCGDGLACIYTNGNGACRALCSSSAPCEGAAESCVMLSDLPSPEVGFCR